MSATNDDCGALFGAHRCDACGTSIIYPLGSVPEPCQRCRIAALESELSASQAHEAVLREALTPFADIATALDADVPQMRRAASVPVDVALLRRARAALAAGGEEGSKPEYDPSVDFDGRDDEYVFPEDGEGARARLREALTELERAASSILEHARFNRADTAPGAQHNSRIARANRAVREARAALAADKDEDHGTTD